MKEKIKEKILNLCNLCGKCVSVCPSYRVYKKESFSPRGRLFLLSHEIEHKSFEFCLFCERCERICPHHIGFPTFYLEKLKEKENPLLTFLNLNNFINLINLKKELPTKIMKEEGDIIVYYSCGLKYLYPSALERFEEILKKRGISTGVPKGLVCCGAIFLNLGLISNLKENALKNLEILEKTKGYLVIFCATCLWMFKKIYPQVFKDTKYEKGFIELSKRAISAYNYLSLKAEDELKILEEKKLRENILFHLPCHLTEDFNLVKNKIETRDFCCGSAKFFLWLKNFQKENKSLWVKNLENIEILATFCTGCYLNFNALLKKPPLILHWLELL